MGQGQAKPEGVTYWSENQFGDVEIPEICVESIDYQCQFEETGCKRLHAKYPFHWQMECDGKWINFGLSQSQELEVSFQDPAKNECNIAPIDINMLEPSARELFKRLVVEKSKANFTSMIINDVSCKNEYKIRRLSTPSAAILKSSKATVFEWYFLDRSSKWIKYGNTESAGDVKFTSNVTSNDIEKQFIIDRKSIFKFKSASFEYELDFFKMIQINRSTGKGREVQRRPKKQAKNKALELPLNETKMNGLPAHWDSMLKSDSMILVLLTPPQEEYAKVERLIKAEVANVTIISINRIQNPFLWRPFKNKMDELLLNYRSELKLNMQKMLHGTKIDIVEKICKENFDWRLHGTSTGQLYGRGTYFSNSSAYSHNYSPRDSYGRQFMMVARVLVGYTTKGNPSMTRPPLNSKTEMLYDTTVDNVYKPQIFVKYDKQEYYPEYVIEYTTKLHNIPTSYFQKTSSSSCSIL